MDDELQLFLRDWRNELKRVEEEQTTQVTIPSDEERRGLCSAATATVGGKRDEQELCFDDEEEQSLLLLQKRRRLDETNEEGSGSRPLFVLSCGGDQRTKSRSDPPRHKQVNEGILPENSQTKKSLVETLIADLVRTQ